ncbi:MAG: hypothetical protein WD048_14580 [Chitinophagales bacterium]
MKTLLSILFFSLIFLTAISLHAKDIYTVYNEKGNKVKEVVQIDEKNHKVVKYHENGAIEEQGYYKNGEKNACWLRYDEKGNCISRVYFDKGVRTGVWNIQAYNGTYSYQIAYEDDKAIQIKKIAVSGKVLEEIEP